MKILSTSRYTNPPNSSQSAIRQIGTAKIEKFLDLTNYLAGLAIYSRNSMNVILGEKNEQFDIKADTGFNALKYRYLYEAMQKDRNIKSEEPNQ